LEGGRERERNFLVLTENCGKRRRDREIERERESNFLVLMIELEGGSKGEKRGRGEGKRGYGENFLG
jgi:hypothetical protein